MAAGGEDAADGAGAEAGDAEQELAGGGLMSTGKWSRCFSAQASLGSASRSSMPYSPLAAISAG